MQLVAWKSEIHDAALHEGKWRMPRARRYGVRGAHAKLDKLCIVHQANACGASAALTGG
jgi:hypothetical protein